MFNLVSDFKPTGDQPQAIEALSQGIIDGKKFQTLLGVTGSGKTFTMANIIQKVQKPTLVLAHNKTLAGQLYSEFKEFFPNNAVEYFVSYYDYYQPESYIPQSDTYIEKDASINDEIDKLRHSATLSLFERRDVIIVASVSCIYGLGDPEDYELLMLSLRPGMSKSRNDVMKHLVEMQYNRNEMDFKRGTFRAKGDILEVYPSNTGESALRIEFWGDEIEKISEINPLTGKSIGTRAHVLIGPNSHYATSETKLKKAITTIEEELQERIEYFKSQNKLKAITPNFEFSLEQTDEEAKGNVFVMMIISLVLFYAIYFCAYQVSSSITTEKTSKIMETLVTSTSPRTIILGKTIGIGLVGLMQMVVIVGTALISAKSFLDPELINSALDMSSITISLGLIAILYFILGYFEYSLLYALTGSTVSKPEDIQSANTPVSIISIIGFYLAYFTMMNPASNLNVIASLVPISSPFCMPLRIMMGLANLTDVVLSVVILLVTIAVIAKVAIKIYSNAILNYGTKMTFKDMVKIYKDKKN